MNLGKKSIYGLLGAAMLWSMPAFADIIEDPLHGFCNGTGSGTCLDNGTNTPLGNSTTFGFSISPGPQTGDMFLVLLVPNNYAHPASFGITGIQGGATNSLSISTSALFAGAWSSGTLASFFGISASPSNPIGAFLPTTDALDPGATGFFVYDAFVGFDKIWDNSHETNGPIFDMIGGLSPDLGAYIVSFCGEGCTGNTDPYVATANSGALLVNGSHSVPEPASAALFGAGLLGLGWLRRRKSR